MKPEYPEAAVAMITVSTGQSKPDEARLWLDRAIEAQIDYLPAYDKYFWSLHPRWGGSHRAMYDFGLACLASGRFDTDVPYQFYYALESISEDLESRQALINKPETYEHLKRMFNGYLAARAGSSLAFFKTLYAAEAWKRGDYEAAARRFRELGSAAQPQTVASHYGSSLQRVRGEAYVRTGDTGEDVQRMITAAQEDRHEEALALCTGLLARVAQASDEAFYLQTWQGDLARREALASGKFVPLQPDSSFKGWKVLHGDWRVTEDGWVQGQTTRERGLLLVLDQTLDTDFECQVVVSFVKSPYKFGFNAGLMVGFADENPEEFLSFLIYRAEKKATLSSRFSTNESFAVTALVQELESTIEMRVEKGRVYTWVNGKAAHAGLPVVSWAGVPGRRIGLGSYVWIPDVTVRFRDFRLRLLEDESAPAAE
jgi:hypothetical protein